MRAKILVLVAVAAIASGQVVTRHASSGGGTWGSITGTLTSQADLNTALTARLVASANLSDLSSSLTARTNLGLGNVENTALSMWAGSTNLVTLGTVTAGMWHGTRLGLLYGGTNADLSGTGGAHFFLRQNSSGAAIDAVRPGCADLSDAGTGCAATLPGFPAGAIIGTTDAQTLSSKTLTSPSLGAGSSPVTETWTVGAGGVTANTLVQMDASAPSKIVAATTGAYGMAISTVSAAGSVEVARSGTVNCVADNATTAGDLVILGTGSAVNCKDSGQTSSSAISIATRIIGVFRSSVSGGQSALVELTPAHFGTQVMPSALGASSFAAQTDAATVTWAISSVLNAQASLTFTAHSGSRTLNITGPLIGGNYVLKLIQDGTGGEGLTLGSGCAWKLANNGSGAVTLTNAANAIDVLTFVYDGTNCLASIVSNLN